MARQEGMERRGKEARFLSTTRTSVVITAGAHVFRVSKWWLAGTLVVLMGVGLGALSLVKIWVVTPKGFAPAVRVSWLDMVQARTLATSAREHMAAGRWREAALSWRGAVANHPADVALLRGWLEAAVTADARLLEEGGAPLNQAGWLLRLGGTNAADVDLAVRLLGRLGMRDGVLQVGGPLVGKLGSSGAGQVLKARFEAGDYAGFDQLWTEREKEFQSDSELALYREAWKAHWGPPSTLREGRERLVQAQSQPGSRVLALRLMSKVAGAREDMDEHGRLLGMMAQEVSARVEDHVEHWRLLSSHGRVEEAKRLARESNLTPERLMDVNALVEAFLALGMPDRALVVVEKRPRTIRADARLLLLHAQCLEAMTKWEELRSMALSLRLDPGTALPLQACSYGLEALALKRLGRDDAARAASAKAAESPGGEPGMTLAVATSLAGVGFPEAALGMLRVVASDMGDSVPYWNQRLRVASMTSDVEELVRSSERVARLLPDSMSAANNHAVALIMARQNAAEAVRITFRTVSMFPRNVDFQINHALALTMNDRADEAAGVLERIRESSLAPVEITNFHLAWFDVCLGRRDWAGARKRYAMIDRRQLQPLQLARLDREFRGLPPP